MSRATLLALCTIVLAGCPGGRWDRYSGGGSFIGSSPDLSPNGDVVIYASNASGRGDIYAFDIEQATVTCLTNNPNYEGDPEYSPNGKRIVFIREKNDVAKLWIMNADGTQQSQLTSGTGYDSSPSFSPDGQQIVFTRNVSDIKFRPGTAASAEIFIIGVDGNGEKRLTNNEVADFQPSFSPDGKKIVFDVGAEQIFTMNVDGSHAKQIGSGASATYSNDGKNILYVSGQFGRQLSVMDADGSNSKPIVDSKHYMSYPTFSSDDKHVLYLDQPTASGTGTIVLLQTSDKTKKRLVDTSVHYDF